MHCALLVLLKYCTVVPRRTVGAFVFVLATRSTTTKDAVVKLSERVT